MTTMLLVTIPALSGSASAQTRRYYRPNRMVYSQQYYVANKPSFYSRHRKAVNLAAGSLAGALIGGLIGGKRGAAIGALGGLGGGAILTAKQQPRNYYRFY